MIDYIALANYIPELLVTLGIVALVVGLPHGIQKVLTARNQGED